MMMKVLFIKGSPHRERCTNPALGKVSVALNQNIASCYWNMVHGTTPEEIKQDLGGMQTMSVLGYNMAYFLKCKEVGSKLVPMPPRGKAVFTNFTKKG